MASDKSCAFMVDETKYQIDSPVANNNNTSICDPF